ncbi:MAG: hydrogenase, partial [Tissierellia bacterium]|nr:hydrogenase [Tissierellia bacterium]
PIKDGEERAGERAQVLYGLDKISNLRFSHENPSVIKCYEDYLQKPLSDRSHKLLHTDQNTWELY